VTKAGRGGLGTRLPFPSVSAYCKQQKNSMVGRSEKKGLAMTNEGFHTQAECYGVLDN